MLQNSSIKKLNEIYRFCEAASNDINGFRTAIQQRITEVIRAESQKVKGGKFSLYDYVSKDPFRPVMQGVYHEDGYKIACDGHILVAIKDEYDPSLEGRIFKKDGEEAEGRYPNWRRVIPQRDGDWEPTVIDEKKFNEWVEERRAQYLAETGKRTKWDETWLVRIGDCYARAEYFSLLTKAAKEIGTDVVYVNKKNADKAWMIENENGLAIAMPVYVDETDNRPYLEM